MIEKEFCPLFGAFPPIHETPLLSRCVAIIEDARCLCGGFEYLSKQDNPDPESIERTTGFPAAWTRSARLICRDSGEIIFDSQHMTGALQGGGWNQDNLRAAVNEIASDVLMAIIGQRAGIDPGFEEVMTPAIIFALLAIGEAWQVMTEIQNGGEKKTELMNDITTATLLLTRAQAESFRSDAEKMRHIRDSGQIGQKASLPARQARALVKNGEYQKACEEISRNRPKLSKEQIAETIARKLGGKESYILKKISKRKATKKDI